MSIKVATLDSVDLNGKKVLLRVDFNSPLNENKKIIDFSRIKIHVKTIRELIDKNASVAILTHQGRPGMEDFSDLSEHSLLLEKELGYKVNFIDDIIGPHARNSIFMLKDGEVLMLDNVRFLSEENIEASGDFHSKSYMVRKLAPLFNYFINDAFATAHRKHASIVGFPYVLPSLAGRVMESEVIALKEIRDPKISPKIFVLGGTKINDSIRIINNILKNSNSSTRVLLTGLVSELFLFASGIDIGKSNKEKLEKLGGISLLSNAKSILLNYKDRILLPEDFVIEGGGVVDIKELPKKEGLIKDIGEKTIEEYSNIMREAKVIVLRGPAGVIEEKEYMKGSIELVKNAASTNAKVILGGGHLTAVLDFIPENLRTRIHNSSGGGALLLYLSGEMLPGIEALSFSASKFNLDGIQLE
ncbi:phosphoglycerate kinase [Fervidicoccus fontis]|uniref:Phosphoglycerate kinase n=1 Tax=Fervidicoccus fontis TaxID=683846 RepID=A0A843AAE7_9CREN|nr:phosphoglycerate kinase [Fervidicoccus fontis]MBE9391675.1 phosphoglycerate kinase [Fervidicoccus fontis]